MVTTKLLQYHEKRRDCGRGKFKWNLFYTLHVYIFNVFFIGSSHVLNSMYIFVGHFLIILKDIQDTEAATGDVL